MTGMRGVGLAVVLACVLVAPASALAAGELTQKAGTAACISDSGTGGDCQDGTAMRGAIGVAISPDGKSLYSNAYDSDAVTIFDRDPTTGALSQKAGTAGCISDDGSGGDCQDGVGLAGPNGGNLAVSPDGKNVYMNSYDAAGIAIFDRDTTTGELTQKAGTAGCVSETGTGGDCQDGVGLVGSNSLAVSPDGKSVYATSYDAGAVAVFDRNTTTGALTQKAGTAACISDSGTGGDCEDGLALLGSDQVTVSADGKSVYSTAVDSGAVVVFDRNTTTGALAQKASPAGCISQSSTGGKCQTGVALAGAFAITVSPDDKNVYAGSDGPSNSVTIFDRNTTTGGLTQKPDSAGCISESGTGGACQDGAGLLNVVGLDVSPAGDSVYAAAYANGAASGGVTLLDRDAATGELTPVPGTAGCVSDNGSDGDCQDGVGLAGARTPQVSPDGKNVYVTSLTSNAVAVFDRNTGPSQADLSIANGDAPDPVFAGQELTYSLSLESAGRSANGVVVTDQLPAGVTFVSASTGCVNAAGTVTCNAGTVTPGTPKELEIVVRPTTPNPALSNTATATTTSSDPDMTNNSATAKTNVRPPADVSIAMTDDADPVYLGGAVTYRFTVINAGPGPSDAVSVTDELSGDVEFVSASGGCLEANAVVTCDLGAMSNGATATKEIVVRPTVPDLALFNTATVDAVGDTNLDNNASTTLTTVRRAPAAGPGPAAATPRPPLARDASAPALGGLKLSKRRFRAGSALPRLARTAASGTVVSFRLSERATVRLAFARCSRVGSRGRCTRFRSAGAPLAMEAGAGLNRLRFQGRLSRARRLPPGRYRMTVTATDAAGNRSAGRTAGFVLLPARR